jgi:predicted phosphodiesterase
MKLGIISDIHEDVVSLREAINVCENNQCDEIACLGDIAGFDSNFYTHNTTRDVSECLSIIQSSCKYVVIGNHDLYAIKKLPKSNIHFSFPENWYQLDIDERRKINHQKVWLYESELPNENLNPGLIEFLQKLPESIMIEINGMKILLSHFIYPDLTGSSMFRFQNPWEIKPHIKFMQNKNIQIGFSGHMHPNGLMVGKPHEIKQLAFSRKILDVNYTQYFGPSIANSINKSALLIVDFNEKTIEAIKIKRRYNKLYAMYERIFKAN